MPPVEMSELHEHWLIIITVAWILASGFVLAFYSLLKISEPSVEDMPMEDDMVILYRGEGPPGSHNNTPLQ